MPQQTLPLAGGNMPIRQIQVDVDDGSLDLWDESVVSVRVRLQGGDLTTVFARRLPGREALYVNVIAETVFREWATAATYADIRRAAEDGHKVIRRTVRAADQA